MGELGLSYTLNRVGSMFTLFFTESAVTDFDSAKSSDTVKFAAYFNDMLDDGIYLPPSQFEANFVSTAHKKEDLIKTVDAVRKALARI
jgi:glutamate-1-semialdehyde 2,1-aminomutase